MSLRDGKNVARGGGGGQLSCSPPIKCRQAMHDFVYLNARIII